MNEGGNFDNPDDWLDVTNYSAVKFIDIKRVEIDLSFMDFDLIDWYESDIKTQDGKWFTNVLISFEDLYKEKPQALECNIEAILCGSKIIYDGKVYEEVKDETKKGRKSLEWDLFYQELMRYILVQEEGILPIKQEVVINHMQNWCKQNHFSNGSRGSIQPKISAIYKVLQHN